MGDAVQDAAAVLRRGGLVRTTRAPIPAHDPIRSAEKLLLRFPHFRHPWRSAEKLLLRFQYFVSTT